MRVADLLSRINESDWPGLFENEAAGVAKLKGGASLEPYQVHEGRGAERGRGAEQGVLDRGAE